MASVIDSARKKGEDINLYNVIKQKTQQGKVSSSALVLLPRSPDSS